MTTTEQLTEICDELATGKSLRAICRDRGLAESTVRRWFYNDEDAAAHSAHARELGCDALADECKDISDDLMVDPAHKRIMIDTRIRLIGKWSQRYSDKLTVTNNTTVTHRHDLSRLTDDELTAFERLARKATVAPGDIGREVAPPPDRLH